MSEPIVRAAEAAAKPGTIECRQSISWCANRVRPRATRAPRRRWKTARNAALAYERALLLLTVFLDIQHVEKRQYPHSRTAAGSQARQPADFPLHQHGHEERQEVRGRRHRLWRDPSDQPEERDADRTRRE